MQGPLHRTDGELQYHKLRLITLCQCVPNQLTILTLHNYLDTCGKKPLWQLIMFLIHIWCALVNYFQFYQTRYKLFTSAGAHT